MLHLDVITVKHNVLNHNPHNQTLLSALVALRSVLVVLVVRSIVLRFRPDVTAVLGVKMPSSSPLLWSVTSEFVLTNS